MVLVTTRIYCKTEGCRKYSKLNEEGYCPVCKPPPQEEDEADQIKYTICKEVIDENTDGMIGCDVCQKWFHPKCAGPAELVALWDLLSKASSSAAQVINGTLLWICPDCSQKSEQIIKISNQSCAQVSSRPTSQVVDLTASHGQTDAGNGKQLSMNNNGDIL